MKPNLKIPPKARKLLSELSKEAKKRGASLYLVGGAVRDFALGRLTRDLDFTVEGDPTPLVDFCAKLIKAKPVPFDSFGTWRLIGGKDWDIDFATTRKEDYPSPASLPVVSKPAHILEDLKRRDFTINAMALRLGNAEFSDLIDPFNGLKDLENKVIEILHPESFRDDPTRVFRAARYAGRLHFQCSQEIVHLSYEALKAGYPQKLSRHRLSSEFLKILSEKNPNPILNQLRDWGYLDLIDPRLSALSWPHWEGLGEYERLGVLAFSLKENAEEFLASLSLSREISSDILSSLKIAREKASPREELPKLSRKILKLVFPEILPSALSPLKISGKDLKALGISPGPAMGEWLKEIARLQWLGKIKSKPEAIHWLKKSIH